MRRRWRAAWKATATFLERWGWGYPARRAETAYRRRQLVARIEKDLDTTFSKAEIKGAWRNARRSRCSRCGGPVPR